MFNELKIVAEIGMTHDGSFGLAASMIKAAADSGANVVKFQIHIADAETTKDAPEPPYFSREKRYDYFERTKFSYHQWVDLVQCCFDYGVIPCASVFSIESLFLASESGFRIIKIPSGEVTNLQLLKAVADLDLPVIMSTGMSAWSEIQAGVEMLRSLQELSVLQCTSLYPTPSDRVGLNVLAELSSRYSLPVGLSDHTLTSATSVAAVALGATVIEKHFTLSKSMYGPDARFSLDPYEFSALVQDVKFVSEAISHPVNKDNLNSFREMRTVFQKSLVAKTHIKVGDVFTEENLCVKKPGTGISADQYFKVLGGVCTKSLRPDELLTSSHIAISVT